MLNTRLPHPNLGLPCKYSECHEYRLISESTINTSIYQFYAEPGLSINSGSQTQSRAAGTDTQESFGMTWPPRYLYIYTHGNSWIYRFLPSLDEYVYEYTRTSRIHIMIGIAHIHPPHHYSAIGPIFQLMA